MAKRQPASANWHGVAAADSEEEEEGAGADTDSASGPELRDRVDSFREAGRK